MADEFHTSDLSIAAWLRIHGYGLTDCGMEGGQRGRHWYKFTDHDGKAGEVAMGFANSREAQFDAALRYLKRLVYATRDKVPARSKLR